MAETIDCRQALELLQDYLKREITPEIGEEIRQHLHRCRGCFAHLRFEENFFQMLESRCRRETCPEALRARIRAVLRAEAGEG